MRKLLTRIKCAFSILFGRYNHFIVIDLKHREFVNLVMGEDFEIRGHYAGMQPYVHYHILKTIVENTDEMEMELQRIELEANNGYFRE